MRGPIRTWRRLSLLAIFATAVLGFAVVPADAAEIRDFLGSYVGRAISAGAADPDLSIRDLSVRIHREDRGRFRIDWTTITYGGPDDATRKSYSIVFKPTDRRDVFGSAMRMDKFGHRVPHDPLAGEPFIWARLVDRMLSVFALHIADEGGYEIQRYDRTLRDDGGLDLVFTRLRDGAPYKRITGTLERIND